MGEVASSVRRLQGGCLCGKLRFWTEAEPLRTLVCHCTFCQRVTGSSFYAESLLPKSEVHFNDAPLSSYRHTSDHSGHGVYVHFCPSCGSTVGLTFERWPDLRAISRGCWDDPNAVEVTSHIWTRSAQSGVALPAGVDCFVQARATLHGQPEPAVRHAAPVMAGSS